VLNEAEIASADGHFALVSQDGLSIATSHKILVLPHQNTKVHFYGRLRAFRADVLRQDGQPAASAVVGSSISFLPGECAVLQMPRY
jgi:hypothetical protein